MTLFCDEILLQIFGFIDDVKCLLRCERACNSFYCCIRFNREKLVKAYGYMSWAIEDLSIAFHQTTLQKRAPIAPDLIFKNLSRFASNDIVRESIFRNFDFPELVIHVKNVSSLTLFMKKFPRLLKSRTVSLKTVDLRSTVFKIP